MTASPRNKVPAFPMKVLLRDGSTATIRPVSASDRGAIEWLLQEMSPQAQLLRFGEVLTAERLHWHAERISTTDKRFTLLATVGDPERVIAEGGFTPQGGDWAMVSITVPEPHRGRGLGTHILGALAQAASARGINEFKTAADPDNHDMVTVIAESGYPIEVSIEPGRLGISFPTAMTSNAAKQFEARERVAAAHAVRRFLEPQSVAVIGASRNPGSISGRLFRNLLLSGFRGPVYPVNPSSKVVQSVPAYASIGAIPEKVDLAVIAVPANAVEQAVEECIQSEVASLVIITAGFAEAGDDGRRLQDRIMERCRAAGVRVIGPNCMGVHNTDPEVGLSATFAPASPPEGNIAFASQSGALGLAIIEFAEDLGLGVSSFVSLGNKADISGNDLLCYWHEDDRTDVILLYLESFGNPVRFSRLARTIGRNKPIIAVKSGRSTAGARAASSHTGALLGSSDRTVDALFRQSGVIRTDTLAEMFDVATILSRQAVPRGLRVGVISNAGGPGILCADALEAAGAQVPELSDETRARLARFLPPHAGLSNPVDLIASASSGDYHLAVETLLDDADIDALIVINIPITDSVESVASSVQDAARSWKSRKPVLFTAMTSAEHSASLRQGDFELPVFAYPEAAARALARCLRYVEWRRKPIGRKPELDDIRPAEAASIVAAALERGDSWLDPESCWQLLDCYGLPAVAQRVVSSIDEIPAVSEQLSSRLVLKASGPDLLHKTEVGAVDVGLAGPDEALEAAREMDERLSAAELKVSEWIVQSMAEDGVEMLVGAVHDPQFGPVIACGAGGVMVELMQDISFRLAPLTDVDAAEMIEELKSNPLLTGFRGRPAADVAALEETLLRIGRMIEDIPQIVELDCNPVLVHSIGVTIVDARIRVAEL